jgi:hypothetical protein
MSDSVAAHTRAANNSLMLRQDDGLFSNRHTRMFTIIADSVGRHDMLFPACDRQRYLDDYGIAEHLNCRDNYLKALAARGHHVPDDRLPDPIDLLEQLKGGAPFDASRLPALSELKRGDVVVFLPPHDPHKNYVKRLVGLPGDTLMMRDKILCKGILYYDIVIGPFAGTWQLSLTMAPNSPAFRTGRPAQASALAWVSTADGEVEVDWWSEPVRVRP